jgi:hypothetical protein
MVCALVCVMSVSSQHRGSSQGDRSSCGAAPSSAEGVANAGCERLISEGTAAPVCDVEDVLALLAVGSTETL